MRTVMLALSLILLLMLTACNSSGTLKILNQTSYNVYFTVDGHSYTIPGHETKSVEINTGNQTIFTGVVEKKVHLQIYGETWMIRLWDGDTPIYIKDTTVSIRSGETTKIYCAPILAAVKIKNHGTQAITAMTYTRHQPPFENTQEVVLENPIQPNEEFFTSFQPSPVHMPTEPDIYFTFHIRLEDGTWLSYGDETTILYVDEEFIIDVQDLAKRVAVLN